MGWTRPGSFMVDEVLRPAVDKAPGGINGALRMCHREVDAQGASEQEMQGVRRIIG
jgi:hypothetical protein